MMKKLLINLICVLSALLLVSCTKGGALDASGEGTAQNTSTKMTATVVSILADDKLEVDVIAGDYGASGVYWVIVSEQTALYGRDGESIQLSDIRAGDTVEIRYGGQVMMSYPPQVVAGSITLCK